MVELHDKFVCFKKYCAMCVHKDTPETEDPCDHCLEEPINTDSHKPHKFELNTKEEKHGSHRIN